MEQNKVSHLIIIFFILTFKMNVFSSDKNLTVTKIYKKLKPLLTEYYRKKEPAEKQAYYIASFPTDKSRIYKKTNSNFQISEIAKKTSEWADSQITLFSNNEGLTQQIALESYGCNIDKSLDSQNNVKQRFEKVLEQVTLTLFSKSIHVSNTEYKKLGPHLHTWTRVLINSSIDNVRKMRISRGLYKCDGQPGYGYRFDFFL